MQWKINDTVICLRMEKNLTAKTPPGDFQVTTTKTPLLSQQAVTSKEIPSTLPSYSWTLTSIPNWTCSIVTVPLFYERLPSMWLIVARIPVRNSTSITPTKKIVGCKVLQFIHTMKIRIHCNFFKRKRWTRSRTLSPVTICLNRACSMLVQLVYRFTALKTILLYV